MTRLQVILNPQFLDVLIQIPEFSNLPQELDPDKTYELILEVKALGEPDQTDETIARSADDAEANGDAPDDGGVVGGGTKPPRP